MSILAHVDNPLLERVGFNVSNSLWGNTGSGVGGKVWQICCDNYEWDPRRMIVDCTQLEVSNTLDGIARLIRIHNRHMEL